MSAFLDHAITVRDVLAATGATLAIVAFVLAILMWLVNRGVLG